MRIRLLDDNLPARLNELARVLGAGTLRRMPAGAAHVPQGLHGLHLCGSISTDTILYIHTVFHDDPGGVMGRRLAVVIYFTRNAVLSSWNPVRTSRMPRLVRAIETRFKVAVELGRIGKGRTAKCSYFGTFDI